MEFKLNVMSCTLILVAVFAIVNCRLINAPDYDEENYYAGVPVYTPSRECSMAGGICVQEGDCAPGQLAQKSGLCEDHEMGVECCYEVTPREAPCRQFGGECMDSCGQGPFQALANDCGRDQKCCILVK